VKVTYSKNCDQERYLGKRRWLLPRSMRPAK
jgi:hypothetical protein